MKIQFKKLLTLLMVMALSMTFSMTPTYAETLTEVEQEATALSVYDKDFLHNMELASAQYTKLITSFSPDNTNGVLKASDYPDYYGGSYINEEGKFVIYLVEEIYSKDEGAKMRAQLTELLGAEVIFSPCKYSFKHLTEVMDKLNEVKVSKQAPEITGNFNSYMIKDAENRVMVELDKYSDEKVKEFTADIMNDDCIYFVQAEKALVDEVDVNPGDMINANAGNGSVGYRVRLDGIDGIATAAHVANSTSSSSNGIRYSGTKFAETTARQQSGSVDGAYCKVIDSSYVPTNSIASGTLSTAVENLAAGQLVNKRGKTTGITSGTIQSTNASGTFSGIPFTNLTTASYDSDPGDSGGLVYSYYPSSGDRRTVGLHKGSGTYAYYSKASLVNEALGITRY